MFTSIIIVNFNFGKTLENCISSILKTQNCNFEIILVDNASTDNSHKTCKEKYPEIVLVENDENLGYAEGNNIGIKNSKGDFIVILNPDTVVEPNWLENLHQAYKKYGDGFYQPKIMKLDNKTKIENTGYMVTLYFFSYQRGFNEKDNGQYDEFSTIGYASGACLFTSKKILEKIGNFDPYLFAYYDEINLIWKAAQLGIKSYYVPASTIYHQQGTSFKKISNKKFYLMEKNRWYCYLTLYSRKTLYKILPGLLLLEAFLIFYYLANGMIKEKIKAHQDLFRDRILIKKKYYEFEEKKIKSDKYIIQKIMYIPTFKLPYNSRSGKIRNSLTSFLEKISLHFL